jgi:hypothetical protein
VIEDIVKITCLVLEEGEECKFIHKSVQEYYSACFIKGQPDESVKRFYDHSLSKWTSWSQELDFLSMIDKYRFLKWFFIPEFCRTLSLDTNKIRANWKPNLAQIEKVFVGSHIEIRINTQRLYSFTWPSITGESYVVHKKFDGKMYGIKTFSFNYSSLLEVIREKTSTLSKKIRITRPVDINEECYEISIKDIFASGIMKREFKNWAENLLKEIHTDLVSAKRYVNDIEESKQLFDL